MLDRGHQLSKGRTIRAKLVGDDTFRLTSLLLHQPDQQALGGLGVAASLDDFVENIAVLIHSAPQPVFPATDHHDHLVQMPDIIQTWRFPTRASGIVRAEFLCPASDCLIGNDSAALQQHFLDQTQAQWKPEIQPDRMGDHSGRKMMALVANWLLLITAK